MTGELTLRVSEGGGKKFQRKVLQAHGKSSSSTQEGLVLAQAVTEQHLLELKTKGNAENCSSLNDHLGPVPKASQFWGVSL